MHNLLFAILFFYHCAEGQLKGSANVYNSTEDKVNTIMPVMQFSNRTNWYAEARYNYDCENTLSLYAGKTFRNDGKLSWTITPLGGIMSGTMNGGSAGLNITADYKNFFYSTESQYSFSWKNPGEQYQYSWSELGYQPAKWLYGGLTVQQIISRNEENKWSPGGFLALSVNNISFPVYVFNPYNDRCSWLAGIVIEWEQRAKIKKQKLTSKN